MNDIVDRNEIVHSILTFRIFGSGTDRMGRYSSCLFSFLVLLVVLVGATVFKKNRKTPSFQIGWG